MPCPDRATATPRCTFKPAWRRCADTARCPQLRAAPAFRRLARSPAGPPAACPASMPSGPRSTKPASEAARWPCWPSPWPDAFMVDQSRFEVRLNRAADGTLQARFEPAENFGAASALLRCTSPRSAPPPPRWRRWRAWRSVASGTPAAKTRSRWKRRPAAQTQSALCGQALGPLALDAPARADAGHQQDQQQPDGTQPAALDRARVFAPHVHAATGAPAPCSWSS